MGEPGRPAFDEDWYRARLEEMRPILELGNSIRYAAIKTGNEIHLWVIYEKYKQNDWFSKKVDAYQSMPGEIINNLVIRLSNRINDKIIKDLPIDRNDIEIIKLVAEKHRSAQPFFVSRTETAEVDPNDVGRVLDKIENDYGQVAEEAKKMHEHKNKEQTGETDIKKEDHAGPTTKEQVVETNASLQNKEQTGADSNVQPK